MAMYSSSNGAWNGSVVCFDTLVKIFKIRVVGISCNFLSERG